MDEYNELRGQTKTRTKKYKIKQKFRREIIKKHQNYTITYFGHVKSHNTMMKTEIEGNVEEEEKKTRGQEL